MAKRDRLRYLVMWLPVGLDRTRLNLRFGAVPTQVRILLSAVNEINEESRPGMSAANSAACSPQ